jgi:hypothetical protein
MNKKARIIAYYLPQYHPIPENDEWWGKGFTEWTNVAKAKPLFWRHYQPHVPADLGFYDLRLPIVREQQAQMAKEAGVEGFCYWHYWFSGKQLLEKPFEEVLKSGNPDFPFCLGWANRTWTSKYWQNKKSFSKDINLIEQHYSEEDHINHFNYLLPAFRDKRYIKVDDKPLFVFFRPMDVPDCRNFIDLWQSLAKKNGLKGIYFVGIRFNYSFLEKKGPKECYNDIFNLGFDGVNSRGFARAELKSDNIIQLFFKVIEKFFKMSLWKEHPLHFWIRKYNMKKINKYMYVDEDKSENVYPTLIPNWDRTPRSGKAAVVYTNTTPEVFDDQVKKCLELVKNKEDEHKIIFLQSWNEWAEGNHVEPDLKYGHGFLDVLRSNIFYE